MNKRWIYLLLPGILLLLGCLTTRCSAAAPATVAGAPREQLAKKWALEECILTALLNHGDVLEQDQAEAVHSAARAAYTQAKGDYFPSIGMPSLPLSVTGESVASSVSSTGTWVSVTQNIYDSGLREANVKKMRYSVKSSESSLLRQQQTTANNVITAYYESWLAMRQAELHDTTVQDLEGQLEMIHTRVQVGNAAHKWTRCRSRRRSRTRKLPSSRRSDILVPSSAGPSLPVLRLVSWGRSELVKALYSTGAPTPTAPAPNTPAPTTRSRFLICSATAL